MSYLHGMGIFRMSRVGYEKYQWESYQRIILGFASLWGWFPISFAVIFINHEIVDWISNPWIQYGVIGTVHIYIFGILAYRFPWNYILLAWIFNFFIFLWGIFRIIQGISNCDGLDDIIDLTIGGCQYYSILPRDSFYIIMELFFLIILFRPALLHSQIFIGRFCHWNKE